MSHRCGALVARNVQQAYEHARPPQAIRLCTTAQRNSKRPRSKLAQASPAGAPAARASSACCSPRSSAGLASSERRGSALLALLLFLPGLNSRAGLNRPPPLRTLPPDGRSGVALVPRVNSASLKSPVKGVQKGSCTHDGCGDCSAANVAALGCVRPALGGDA